MIASVAGGVRVGITGVGAHVPERRLTNGEVGLLVDATDEWIATRTGIHERRIAAPAEAASDLALPAASAALARAGVPAASLDLVLVATASPDMLFPATASLVASALGARDAAAYDLSAACAGFVYGLAQGHALIASGLAGRVLVVGTEVLSRFVDWGDRSTAILFADGAGAAVLERVSRGGFLGFQLGSDGTRGDDLLLPAGGSRSPATVTTAERGQHTIRMRGQEVFRFSTRVTVEATAALLDRCGLTIEDVDLYVPHQANRRIIDHAAARLGIPPAKVLTNIDRYGNTSSASIPLVLDEALADGRLQPGATVLMTGVGAGLTWGAALIRWAGARE